MLVVGRVHDSVLSTPVLDKILVILDCRLKTSGESLYTLSMLLTFLFIHDNCIVSSWLPIASTWLAGDLLLRSHPSVLREIVHRVGCPLSPKPSTKALPFRGGYTRTGAVDLLLCANNHAVAICLLVSCTYCFWVYWSVRHNALPLSIRERELLQSKGSTWMFAGWPSAMVRLGASGPPHYCPPLVSVPAVLGAWALWRIINKTKKTAINLIRTKQCFKQRLWRRMGNFHKLSKTTVTKKERQVIGGDWLANNVGRLRECLRARRFWATLSLCNTCMCSWCNGRVIGLSALQKLLTKNQTKKPS